MISGLFSFIFKEVKLYGYTNYGRSSFNADWVLFIMCCRWNNICMYIAFWWYYNINTFWSFLYIQRRRIILRPLLTLYIIVCVLTYFILLIFEPQQTIVERIFDSFTLGYAGFAIIVFCFVCVVLALQHF